MSEPNESQNNLSSTTDAINKSGAFLQNHVMHILEQSPWISESEFPVQVAPFVADPIKHPVHYTSQHADGRPVIPASYDPANLIKAILECQNKIELEETSIDVIGGTVGTANPDGKPSFRLNIECKKLDPDYSDWIFFNANNRNYMNVITKNISSQGFVSLFKIPGTTRVGNQIHVDLKKTSPWSAFEHMISNNSIAVSNERLDRNIYKTKKSLIDDASRQIIKGTYGLVLNELQHQILSGEGYDSITKVYVPIIVTTANLKICKFNTSDINPETGFVTHEPNYVSTNSIIYECAPPKSVRFPHPEFTALSTEHRRALLRWHVLIVSPKGFTEFIKILQDTQLT